MSFQKDNVFQCHFSLLENCLQEEHKYERSRNASQSVWKTGCVVGIAVKTQRLALGIKQRVSVYIQALSLTSLLTSNLSVPQFLEL